MRLKMAWGRESQVHTLMPNFIIVALKMWVYSPKIATNGNFWYKFAHKGKFRRSTEKKLNIGAQLQTPINAMTP